MAVTNKKLASGTLSDSEATLYTVPASTKTIVKSVTLCNTSATAATVTIKFDGVAIWSELSIEANATLHIPQLDHIVEAAKLVKGLSGTDAVIDYYISGKEIA